MEESLVNNCALKLNHLVFDSIYFERKGFKNKNAVKYKFVFGFDENGDRGIVVHLDVSGKKKGEYKFQVVASGYFTLSSDEYEPIMMRQNAVAIIFPYVRSQISLLTAQPEMTPLVLPPFNVAQMVMDAMNEEARNNP